MKHSPRTTLTYVRTLAVVLLVGALGIFALAWSGIYSVAASRGHWAVVKQFLEFGMRHSVKTHSIGIEVPNLADPAMIAAGMGHYEIACATCHGAPGRDPNVIAQQMLPAPPFLPASIPQWKPEELFWITKHGLKYTGMPGWPAQNRDDEVWGVVAALVKLPDMNAETYRAFIGSDTAFGPEDETIKIQRYVVTGPAAGSLVACARCHGVDGAGGGAGAFPRLAGQSGDYLAHTLAAYADGTRPSGIMQPIAAALTKEERTAVAAYYASRQAPPAAERVDPALRDAGARLAQHGDPAKGIAACKACHTTGSPEADTITSVYPRLAGQHAWYLRQQLTLWREGRRGDTPLAKIMTAAVRQLNDADIAALANYYASLPPQASP